MDLIKASYILLWGLSIWDILYILSLVYIWVKRRERERRIMRSSGSRYCLACFYLIQSSDQY